MPHQICIGKRRLGLPEVTLGLIPGYGGTQRLPKLVGKGIANEMIFSAKMIPAAKAKEIGLVNEVYPIEELLTKTKELATLLPTIHQWQYPKQFKP
jgi:enoyl-CoA hydratase